MLWTWSRERDQNSGKTCVFIFDHSIRHNEASGYTFYNPNTEFFMVKIQENTDQKNLRIRTLLQQWWLQE